MSAKGVHSGIEVHDLGMRRFYVKASTGFVLNHDDLTPDELLAIASDISLREQKKRCIPAASAKLAPAAPKLLPG